MLYKFKSQAAADVIMLRENAEDLLKIIGKTPDATGIITVAQIPAAISAIQAEVARREAAPPAAPTPEGAEAEADQAADEPISLRRRAAPFIDLLTQSLDEKKDVVWGV